MDVSGHKNEEQVIRYYLGFLPPKNLNSIINIGGGTDDPYGGMLRKRARRYVNTDIRPGRGVNLVLDFTDREKILTTFQKKEFDWGWCTEVIEHIPPDLKLEFATLVLAICKNVTFTYPTPAHESFPKDPGHTEVKIDWKALVELDKTFVLEDHTTKNGRAIIVLKDPNFVVPKEETRGTTLDGW